MDNTIYDIPVYKSLPQKIEINKMNESNQTYNLSVDDIFKDEPFVNINNQYNNINILLFIFFICFICFICFIYFICFICFIKKY